MNCFRPVKVLIKGNLVIEVVDESELNHIPQTETPKKFSKELKELKDDNYKGIVETKPKKVSLEEKTDKKFIEDEKKFPKVRVTLEAFEELQDFRKKYKCKSYCEVVNRLLNIYDSVQKQNDIND
ncbi:hypothetical protein EHI8A_053130 [Entamoeba histolytica HM-1:IMSS-B]|uniref:Uncharacterized protein n=6 Tax=Entamoeba histolytica TaxID=5759 RepID=C4M6T5_ENTH1|nr:hypothetical protein EHI_054210 [Entamoeba histolytica HM-1:IMSS]EMD49616.1 Hypothetical protein EHI5A_084830 [Entamoeba histolytica KU27]EMH76166.1 hypothetical protein EHI8A_053130 [Entamoeba histolytica HM-1:IMSS-B]EMS16494.1 hypothetical protein KM1_102300 [Entamoeba histolytica HM-3:IMSS]ENY65088.1 hypothetical protein EHI7A_053700 [Entamoeba histolytica HM-1:IMSS-A]GAT97222.1 hypothetical protein CL6EHI_054210 [Entamoeba histolytica]|eukprot:XP_651404.1 hypothetical protein EHI_054210 [Entamoeba histolytica HM-1:IMSS]